MHTLARSFGFGLTLFALPALAEQKAHEHGHAALNVAIEGGGIEMELIAPGADIVGFEHQPDSDADWAAMDAAVEAFRNGLFTLPDAAGCALEAVGVYSALLPAGKPMHFGEHHHDDDHDHGDKHDDHKDEHSHDDHAHGDKDEDHKDDHAHDDHDKDEDHAHDHGDHKDGEEHAEFRVHFHYDCTDTAALTGMQTSYFDSFPNAQELDVAALTASGQVAAELTRAHASIDF